MLLPRRCLPLLFCLLSMLASGLGVPAHADEEPTPPAAKAPESWTYRKGDETRALEVTHLSEALRLSLDRQLKAAGWTREPPAGTEPPAAAKGPTAPVSESTGHDIEELVKRGGRLPEGFVPRALEEGGRGPRPGPLGPPPGRMGPGPLGLGPLAEGASPETLGVLAKATGTLLLRYLDVKDDPVKGPVYEGVLRTVAGGLAQGDGANLQPLVMQMMATFLGGMQDPEKGPVYREILGVLAPALAALRAPQARPTTPAPAPASPSPAPAGPAPAGPAVETTPFGGAAPLRLGGALLAYSRGLPGEPSAPWAVHIAQVPPGSAAAAAGLAPGDRIMGIDGAPPGLAGLKRAVQVLRAGGQLTLDLRRSDGRVERLALDVELDD